MAYYGPILFKTVQNSSKKFLMAQNVRKFSKMVQYGPNSFTIISQNDRSWCDSNWGNSN